jgi:hypothetical protein
MKPRLAFSLYYPKIPTMWGAPEVLYVVKGFGQKHLHIYLRYSEGIIPYVGTMWDDAKEGIFFGNGLYTIS